MKISHFTRLITKKNGVARCIELGVVTKKTIEAAHANLKEALELYLYYA